MFLGAIPHARRSDLLGGVLPRKDGTVWVSYDGSIWEWDNGQWQEYRMPLAQQVFTDLVETNEGEVYAATGEGVYLFTGARSKNELFVKQHQKPIVVPEDGVLQQYGHSTYNKRYSVVGNYPGWMGNDNPEYQYEALFLGIQKDGSLVYVNNRVIALLQDGHWKSFAFDTFMIDSATVDLEGNIWIFSNSEGLFQFDASIFTEY